MSSVNFSANNGNEAQAKLNLPLVLGNDVAGCSSDTSNNTISPNLNQISVSTSTHSTQTMMSPGRKPSVMNASRSTYNKSLYDHNLSPDDMMRIFANCDGDDGDNKCGDAGNNGVGNGSTKTITINPPVGLQGSNITIPNGNSNATLQDIMAGAIETDGIVAILSEEAEDDDDGDAVQVFEREVKRRGKSFNYKGNDDEATSTRDNDHNGAKDNTKATSRRRGNMHKYFQLDEKDDAEDANGAKFNESVKSGNVSVYSTCEL